MIRTVIFDLDGTIANTLPMCLVAFKQAIEPLAGRSLSDEEIIATFGPSEEGTIQALIPEHYEQGLERYLQHYATLHDRCPQPFDGLVPILNYLRSNRIYVAMVTGKGARSTKITLDKFGIHALFDLVETGSPLGPRKVQGIQNVLNRFGLHPDEAIYVGDTPSDIVTAREAKVGIIAAAWAETADCERLQAQHPDEMFRTMQEFSDYIRSRIS